MKAVSLSAVLFVLCAVLNAQPKPTVPLRLSHPLSPGRQPASAVLAAPDTLHVLAIMVDFQSSTDSRITGNGKFMLEPVPTLVDPPPHDLLYFSYKLQFVRNYFRKVSNGKLNIAGTVLNHVFTLPRQMQDYAPASSGDNANLVQLAEDAWRMVDSTYPGFAFNQYDAFVIFHAGVGHDLNLINLLGYDPSPLNLPSLYLGPQAFKDALNDPSFDGIPVSGGSFRIDNTILLPETESQFYSGSLGSQDTLQVSINGLFAASLGSYLGLPDLWNTRTGTAGIGQYGLEDGASFFAYYGLFPPEPCAWEKIRLGWVTPITIGTSTQNIPAPAVGLYHGGPTYAGQDTIYKIPINASEYFLVENRSRDPLGTGLTLQIIQNGIPVNKTFRIDSTGFNNNDIASISGSVVDVSNFDWALLRFLDYTSAQEGGGILIWHIDENIINANFASNSINANIAARGVDLEEAKGPQDIGQSYSFLDQGYGSENGNPYDPWFEGNVASTYTNSFDATSIPNSNANSGARSLVTINKFSVLSPRMTFSVRYGNGQLQPLTGFPKTVGLSSSVGWLSTWKTGVMVGKGDSVYLFRPDGSSGTLDATGLLTGSGGSYPLVYDETGTDTFFVGAKDSSLILIKVVDANADSVYESVQLQSLNIGHAITAPPVLTGTGILIGHADGGVVRVDPSTSQISGVVSGLSGPVSAILFSDCAVTQNVVSTASNRSYSFSTPFRGYAVSGKSTAFFVDTVQRSVTVLDKNLNVLGQASLARWQGSIAKPAVGDVERSGFDDLVMTIGNNLVALNRQAYVLDGFPVEMTNTTGTASPPVLAAVASAGETDVLAVSSTGLVSAYSGVGKQVAGFPIDIGTGSNARPAVFPIPNGTNAAQTGFSVYGNDGNLSAYRVFVNYASVDSVAPVPLSSDFFPASRVYNWPNPVYGNSTHIRYYCSQDANIAVTVFDIAGKKITDLSGRATAGIDSEILWDVSRIQSGVYLARVEATSQGRSQARIIKIAVVK